MMNYLIQVCAGIAAWWLLYRLFFRAKAAAKTNRLFLLCGLLLPFFLPLIPLSVEMVSAAEPILLPAFTISTAEVLPMSVANSINWIQWFYMIGFAGMLLFQLSGLRKFFILKKHASKDAAKNVFRLAEEAMPFSFFGSIFLPQHLPIEQETLILDHEKWHIKLGHSLDVAWAALVQSVLWFFPLMPFYVRDIRNEHEFEVDERMLTNTSFTNYAETLLQISFMPIGHPQFHSFSSPTLKNRLKMMTKTQKQNTWKLLFLLPLIGAMTYLNACNNQSPAPIETEQTSPQVNFGDLDSAPRFPECPDSGTKEMSQECFQRGLMNYLMNELTYPKDLYEAGVEAKVFVKFVIGADGNITHSEVLRSQISSDDPEHKRRFELEAREIIAHMPTLKPGIKDGKPVAVEFVIPIQFSLPKAQGSINPEKQNGPWEEKVTIIGEGGC